MENFMGIDDTNGTDEIERRMDEKSNWNMVVGFCVTFIILLDWTGLWRMRSQRIINATDDADEAIVFSCYDMNNYLYCN